MKTAQIMVVAIFTATTIPMMGRQLPNDGAPASTSGQQSADAAAAHAYSLVVSEMRPVSCQLEGKLNSQSAKPGDLVTVKTTQSMITADGSEIPKGTRLLGRVIAAQAYTKGETTNSQLSIAFYRAEPHKGASLAIHSIIHSVAPRGQEASDSGFGGASMGMDSTPAMGGEAGPMSGGMGGQGGMAGGATGTRAPVAGQRSTTIDRTTDGAAQATNPSAAEMPASMPGPTYGVVRLSDSLAPRYTGLIGVMLQADASGATSGTLFAANQGIRLDAGTRIVLGIVVTGN